MMVRVRGACSKERGTHHLGGIGSGVADTRSTAESFRGRGKTPETSPSIVEMIFETFGKFHFLRFLDSEIFNFVSHDGERKGLVLADGVGSGNFCEVP